MRISVRISIIVGFVIHIHVHIHIRMIIYISIYIGNNIINKISINIDIGVTIRMDRRRTICMYIGGSIRVRCGGIGIGIEIILIYDDVVIAPYFLLVQHVLI